MMVAGHYTTEEAPGAWRNGSLVRKLGGDGTGHPVGSTGKVRGSLGPVAFRGEESVFGYFIEWDSSGIITFMANNAGRLELVVTS